MSGVVCAIPVAVWRLGRRPRGAVSADKPRNIALLGQLLQRLRPALNFPVLLGISGLRVRVLGPRSFTAPRRGALLNGPIPVWLMASVTRFGRWESVLWSFQY
jgi:hypothetical protein